MLTCDARPVLAGGFRLAEGPVWDAPRERLLWVDIEAGLVHEGRLRPARVEVVRRHRLPGTVGAVACAADGRLLVAGRHGLTVLLPDGTRRAGARVLAAGTPGRLNDGGCDPAGRFLVGSAALDGRRGGDVLVRLAGDGRPRVLDTDLTCSNGLAWSPDGRLMYSVDTGSGRVRVRGYGPDGRTGPRRDLLAVGDGLPDGLCADRDGNLWLAVWGAGEVRCYSPAARHLATVRVPAAYPSSAAFAGPGLDTLLISAGGPDGGLFAARPGARGAALRAWDGVSR
ncbi:SMP-30/gluconolactonase/LRE family protein [Actinacidiphila reveromycinica]|uniref:SMP-30/gluconolactonase/LRE family protein n=1 Tax=Actinacidiphila reveromycinica TaxID=659352 RepID=UPI001920ADF6|nr:SMP-30/gluconolactonase/LRE family protein [Streptomyces sp. SN-593]